MPIPPFSDPGELDLTLYQGADLRVDFVVAQGPAGPPWDLTGCTARAKVRPDFATSPILTLTATITAPTAGAISVTATVADLATLVVPSGTPVGSRLVALGAWDLELVAGANVVRVAQGQVTLSREATV